MIKKTLILTFILLLAYGVMFFLKPVKMTQDMYQANIAKTQKFLYEDSLFYDKVLVGTSLSERLVMDSLSEISNLAFGGLSIFDGLKILQQADTLPSTIIIEKNVLEKSENKNFTSYFTNPFLAFFNKCLPMTRADARPLNYAVKTINYGLKYMKSGSDKSLAKRTELKTELKEKVFDNQIREYSSLKDTATIRENITKLSEEIVWFKKRGCRIIFLELPVEPFLKPLPRAVYMDSLFKTVFSMNEYKYILPPLHTYFATTDGIHMTAEAACRYTLYLKETIIIENE